ncbi:MAG: prepilin-type N-terminal cleavage/methylation domain-containing protein [Gammaproteobacteria bacterium]
MRLASKNTAIKQRGLTLIELLIAIAIFAIMATSMFIAFDNVQKAKEVTDWHHCG